MENKERKHIRESKGCFLIRDNSLKQLGDGVYSIDPGAQFLTWLKSEGFESWRLSGRWTYVDWIFVNIDTKVYAPGMPGIKITDVVGRHCITIEVK